MNTHAVGVAAAYKRALNKHGQLLGGPSAAPMCSSDMLEELSSTSGTYTSLPAGVGVEAVSQHVMMLPAAASGSSHSSKPHTACVYVHMRSMLLLLLLLLTVLQCGC